MKQINEKNITVSISKARWNRLLELEKAYKAANRIKKAIKQSETATRMTTSEAQAFILSI